MLVFIMPGLTNVFFGALDRYRCQLSLRQSIPTLT
jgi:hypothetical protein